MKLELGQRLDREICNRYDLFYLKNDTPRKVMLASVRIAISISLPDGMLWNICDRIENTMVAKLRMLWITTRDN